MKLCKFALGAVLMSGALLSAQETSAPQYEVGMN